MDKVSGSKYDGSLALNVKGDGQWNLTANKTEMSQKKIAARSHSDLDCDTGFKERERLCATVLGLAERCQYGNRIPVTGNLH